METDPATEAWQLLLQLWWAQRNRFVSEMAAEGLSPMQAHALRFLGQPRPMSDLAEALTCDASNVTGIVDRLEARGLVERQASPEDRRVKLLALTDEGRRTRDRLLARINRPPAGFARLAPGELRRLVDVLERALGDEERVAPPGRRAAG